MIRHNKIIARAPVRISFSGGGTDIPEYFRKFGGCVLSATINKYTKVEIFSNPKLTHGINVILKNYNMYRFLDKKENRIRQNDEFDLMRGAFWLTGINSCISINIESDVSPGSGLGTSSALSVALIGGLLAYKGKIADKNELAAMAVKLEREILALHGGWQDQYASSYGGLNYFQFNTDDSVEIQKIRMSESSRNILEKKLFLYQLPKPRDSSNLQKSFIDKIINKETIDDAFTNLKLLTQNMRKILQDNKLDDFASLLEKSWELKKKTNPLITNDYLDNIYRSALQNGAVGGKLLGAGGGGTFIFYCPDKQQQKFKESFSGYKGQFMNYQFEDKGFHYYEA